MIRKKFNKYSKSGFTLIELLVVIGIIGLLTAVVLIAVNPGRNFASTRDVTRKAHLNEVVKVIYAFAAEHNGNLPDTDNDDTASDFPTTATCIGTGTGCFDLAAAGSEDGDDADSLPDDPIVPTYISELPVDPSTGTQQDTGYTIYQDEDGRVVASASGELEGGITVRQ